MSQHKNTFTITLATKRAVLHEVARYTRLNYQNISRLTDEKKEGEIIKEIEASQINTKQNDC